MAELKELIRDAYEGEVGWTRTHGKSVVHAPSGEADKPSKAPKAAKKSPARTPAMAEDTADWVDSMDPEEERKKGKA